MSIYKGTRVQQSYRHGFDDGRLQAERDLENQLPVIAIAQEIREEADYTGDAREADYRPTIAYDLGFVRGYREVVLTNVSREESP